MNSRPSALITGATSGIGLALAKIFAENNYNLILVARNNNVLDSTSAKLEKEFGISVTTFAQDLSDINGSKNFFEKISQISVDVLVNNAGFGIHGAFNETSIQKEEELVNLQITALLHLTKICVPAMIASKKGHILNITSVYAIVPVPFQAVYGACKAFIISFSEALRAELEPFGIRVTIVCPGSTRTEFRSRAGISEKSSTSGMSAEAVAQAAFDGFKRGQNLVIPGGVNKLFMNVIRWFPRAAAAKVMIKINRARGVNQ